MSCKIDFHAHILPETWPNLSEIFGYSGWIQMKHGSDGKSLMMRDNGTVFRPVDKKVWSPSVRLNDMDKSGVAVQILSTVPVMFSYWAEPKDTLYLSRLLNDHIYSVIKSHPKRFVGIGTIPMQCPQSAVEEMKRIKHELNLNGIIIGSHINESNLEDKKFDMIWKTCEDLNLPVFIHPWGMSQTGRMSKYWLPYLVGMPAETSTAILCMIFGGVFERFPNLKVCLAHGGGMFPYIFGRAEHGFHVYPNDMQRDNPFPPSKYLGRIYADSLVHTEDALNLAIKTLGEDSIILGSDYPFLLGEHTPGLMVEKSSFDEVVKNKIFFQNACKFLDIDINQYVN